MNLDLDSESRRRLFACLRIVLWPRKAWALIVVGTTLSALMKLPMPLLTGYVIDKVIAVGNGAKLDLICGLLVATSALYLSMGYVVDYTMFRINRLVTIRYKVALLKRIQDLPLKFLADRETGYLMARITQDPAQLNGLLTQILNVGSAAATLVVGLAAVYAINARLAALSTLLVPFFALSFVVFQRKIRQYDALEKEQSALQNRALKDAISAIPLTKLFLLRNQQCRVYLRHMRIQLRTSTSLFNCEYMVFAASGFIGALGPILVVWYGGHEIMQGRLTIGQLVAFSTLLGFLYGPTKTIVSSKVAFLRAVVSLNRVYDLLGEAAEDHPPRAPVIHRSAPTRFDIEYDGVWFGYSDSAPVLRDINLKIEHGETIAIVGPTGAGKSTAIKLLTLLHQPTSGVIRLGGIDIRSLPLRTLRRLITVVSQDVFLFSDSILENIRLANRAASRDEVVHAAELANAAPFIRKLPKDFDTPVGENGSLLSGGQKQLVCLARAILRDSPVIILDEPTSSLDPECERLMKESLRHFTRGRTTIVISHRLSTIEAADRIVVLENGAITAEGASSSLAAASRFYANMAGSAGAALEFH